MHLAGKGLEKLGKIVEKNDMLQDDAANSNIDFDDEDGDEEMDEESLKKMFSNIDFDDEE
jgi:hypothetical protein